VVAAGVVTRLRELQSMRASDTLDDDKSRQLAFDLEQAYAEFHSQLPGRK
jgi:hypothetical protein